MELISHLLVENGVATVITVLMSGVVGFLIARVKRFGKRERAEREVLKAMARKEILDAHERYIVNGESMSVDRYDEMIRICDAYTDLGGNGSAKPFIDALKAKQPWTVTRNE